MESPGGSPQRSAHAAPPSPLQHGLSSPQKAVPVPFLYDDKGSVLYEQITTLEEYTPYRDELSLLEAHLGEIVAELAPGTVLVELGCGDGSKTVTLLRRLLERDGAGGVTYCGIDCSAEALQQMRRTLQATLPALGMDSVALVEAEYVEGVRRARERFPDAPLAILFLGSSIGNFTHPEAVQLLCQLREVAGERVVLMLGCDLMKAADTLHAAYNDSAGVTDAFIKNGMRHALRSVGHPSAERDDAWDYEVVVNAEEEQVEMYLVARESVPDVFPGVTIARGERVLMEISRKFTSSGLRALYFEAGFCHQATWDSSRRYSLQLLLSPLEALERSWADTDRMFACIKDWTAQPIGLRHPFLFYYGHVAAFAKLQLQPGAEKSELDVIFSRGMDPNVLNPEVCHAHPEAPAAWPSREELLDYTGKIRAELRAAVMENDLDLSTLHMVLEHDRMHQETLCYMVAQQRRADWIAGRAESTVRVEEVPAAARCFYLDRCSYAGTSLEDVTSDDAYVRVPGAKISLGTSAAGFVWDNELGRLDLPVGDLLVASHPITVQDFCAFLREEPYANPKLWSKEAFAHFQAEGVSAPATWSKGAEGDCWIHMPEKTYNSQEVADCPVYCSLVEAEAYAARFGARLMTEAEYQNALEQAGGSGVKQLQGGGWEWTSSAFSPFPGFAADPRYPDYSADFWGDHFVLKGASAYTHPSMHRSSWRNFYQSLYRPVFGSFRCVRDVSPSQEAHIVV